MFKKKRKCFWLMSIVLMLAGILPVSNVQNVKALASQEKPEFQVGIYKGFFKGYRLRALISGLDKQDGIRARGITRLKLGVFDKYDVIIMPQQIDATSVNNCANDIRTWVEKGGGIMFLHDAVGYRKHEPIFKEIGAGVNHAKLDKLRITKVHAVTQGLPVGYVFSPGFRYDHIAMKKGPDGETVIENEQNDPVVVVGKFGKGKVVLNGMCPGFSGDRTNSSGRIKEPEGDELKIVVNAIRWLAGKRDDSLAK